jgi:hypothetical protein
MSDVMIIATIMLTFIILGVAIPYMNADLNRETVGVSDPLSMSDELAGYSGKSTTTIFDVLLSIGKMFLFTFGDVPAVIDWFILMPLRLIFAFTIARNIWSGGGG